MHIQANYRNDRIKTEGTYLFWKSWRMDEWRTTDDGWTTDDGRMDDSGAKNWHVLSLGDSSFKYRNIKFPNITKISYDWYISFKYTRYMWMEFINMTIEGHFENFVLT